MPALLATLRARHRLTGMAVASLVALGAVMSNARALTSTNLRSGLPHGAASARTIYVRETANLHLVAHKGTQILHEEGQVLGTLRGRLTAVIDIGYTEATVTFTARSSAGTLSGRGVESYYVSGKTGHFTGRTTVTGGTGAYAHASGSALHTTGLIKRTHYEVMMTIDGGLRS
jgi:hypothetical protein